MTSYIDIYEIICDIIPELIVLQGHGPKTKAGRKEAAFSHHYRGKECLDIHLLKPAQAWAQMVTDHRRLARPREPTGAGGRRRPGCRGRWRVGDLPVQRGAPHPSLVAFQAG